MKKYVVLFLVLLSLVAIAAIGASRSPRETTTVASDLGYRHVLVTIGNEVFDAFVVDTPLLREKGLGGFSGLGQSQAMLFVFDMPGDWGFWMKDMSFPIDIAWLAEDRSIVSLRSNVSPETFPETFFPNAAAFFAIELSAGTLDRIGAEVGDRVDFELP